MHASAGGPLGALLLIAPLAAIPVFAILGVPQFAPVVASPSDDEDLADLGDDDSPRASSPAAPRARSRANDDLFASVEGPSTPASPDSERMPGTRLGEAGASPVRPKSPLQTMPPADVLDQWEVMPETPGPLSRPGNPSKIRAPGNSTDTREGLEIPADDTDEGRVSAEGFDTELLRPDRPEKPLKGRRAPEIAPRQSAQMDRAPGKGQEAADLADDMPRGADAMFEQSGWQSATRRLKELGVRKYHIESRIDEQKFIFTCGFPSPDNPRVVRRFEAEGDTPLEAVEMALQQIDDWRSRGAE